MTLSDACFADKLYEGEPSIDPHSSSVIACARDESFAGGAADLTDLPLILSAALSMTSVVLTRRFLP